MILWIKVFTDSLLVEYLFSGIVPLFLLFSELRCIRTCLTHRSLLLKQLLLLHLQVRVLASRTATLLNFNCALGIPYCSLWIVCEHGSVSYLSFAQSSIFIRVKAILSLIDHAWVYHALTMIVFWLPFLFWWLNYLRKMHGRIDPSLFLIISLYSR